MTDTDTPEISGVDAVIRKQIDVPQVLFRYRHLSEVEPPYLSLDVDLFVARDVAGIEKPDYDAVMTARPHSYMPYNGGVFWTNSNQLIKDCVEMIEGMEPHWQNWTGGQRAMFEASKTGKYRIKEISCSTWNYSPDSPNINLNDKVMIYHFKGTNRKGFMRDVYKHFHP